MGGNITVLAPAGEDSLPWRYRDVFINDWDEEDDYVMLERFVILAL